jgi:hypothetical protein
MRGYRDGYTWMEHLGESGWLAQDGIGDWPHSITMLWPSLSIYPLHALARYLDANLTIEVFYTHRAVSQAISAL